MKHSRIALFLLCLGPASAVAQSSFFTGDTGSSLLVIPEKNGQLQFDTSSSLLHVEYFQPPAGNANWRLGFDLSGKPAGGSTVLWTNGALGSTLGFSVAAHKTLSGGVDYDSLRKGPAEAATAYVLQHPGTKRQFDANYSEVAIFGSAGTSSNELFTPTGAGAGTYDNKQVTTWDYGADYWHQFHTNVFIGARGGLAFGSNVSDLTSKSYLTSSSVGGIPVSSSQSAFLKSKYEEGVFAPIRVDAMWQISAPSVLPGKSSDGKPLARNISLVAYGTKNSVENAQWSPGIGVLLGQPGGWNNFLGGVTATWVTGKVTYSVVTGFSF